MSNKKKQPAGTDSGTTRRQRRAAERAARKAGDNSRERTGLSVPLIAGGAIAIGVLVVAVLALAGGGLDEGGQSVTAAEVAPPPAELRIGRSLGDPNAPVKIETFEDPQCPACGQFTRRIEPLLIAGPVQRGEVFLTYRDMAFLGSESFDAAAAMRAAEELDGKFWEYHDVVFANQDGENRGAFSVPRLADMAELVGLDRGEFLAELEDPRHLAAVEAETNEAQELGVNSTPTLVINGVLAPGVPSWEQLSALIADAT